MTHPQRDDLQPIQAFLQWEAAQSTGRNGTQGAQNDKQAKYIQYSALKEYMSKPNTLEKLLGALFPDGYDAPDADSIREHWLRPFAILVSINHGQMINAFRRRDDLEDEKLPLRSKPANFPMSSIVNSSGPVNLWDLFYERQWKFCPKKLEFNMESDLDERYILPFEVKEKLGRGGSSSVHKIVVDGEYNKLRPVDDRTASSLPVTDMFVIKTYRGRDAEDCFTTERNAFHQLKFANKSPPNIVAYYGTFTRGTTYNLILQYANVGNLEQFIRNTPSPTKGEDILLIWQRLCGLLQGLMHLHGKGKIDDGPRVMLGWHQDLKPENILVTRSGAAMYDCDFLIADLGVSHFKSPTPSQPNVTDKDTFGTNVYGAPETYRMTGVSDQIELNVGQAVDIWSLGCIFSEMATWIVHGIISVEEYRRRRQVEVTLPSKLGVGKGALFHDSRNVLNTVTDSHKNVLNHLRIDDLVTPEMVKHLISEMLLAEDAERTPAKVLAQRATRLIKDCKGELAARKSAIDGRAHSTAFLNTYPNESFSGIQSGPSTTHVDHISELSTFSGHAATQQLITPSMNHSQLPDRQVNNQVNSQVNRRSYRPPQSEPRQQPQLSVSQVLDQKRLKKDPRRGEFPDKNLLTDIKNRDHVFLVDNSDGLRAFRDEAKNVIEALGYIVKRFDPDGIDMFFTQSDKRIRKCKKTSTLVKALDTVDFNGWSDMRSRLAEITEDYKNSIAGRTSHMISRIFQKTPKPPRRLSLYILTDGDWQRGCDLEPTIRSLVTKLIDNDLIEKQVAIQFIRFGHKSEAIQELDRLDAELGLSLDIVDTVPSDGNVWKMLLGGMNPWFDDDKKHEILSHARHVSSPPIAPLAATSLFHQ